MLQIDAEAKQLAEQFLAEKSGKLDQKHTSVEPNLLVSLPCYGGSIQHKTVGTLLDLSGYLSREKIAHRILFVANESLIPKARNHFASVATFTKDSQGKPYSHLLFLDADISFDARYVLRMLELRLPIVALPYARKTINWERVSAASQFFPPDKLEFFAGNPALGVNSKLEISDRPVVVRRAPTGAMMVSTDVFKAFVTSHPERRYRTTGTYFPHLEYHYDFFRSEICGDEYLSEDFGFCENAARLGFSTYILPQAVTRHTGLHEYVLDMGAVAALSAPFEPLSAARPAEEKQND